MATMTIRGEIFITHAERCTTLVSIFAPFYPLNTHGPGDPKPLDEWCIWRTASGRWALTADGIDKDSRAKRQDAVALALRLSGIAPADRRLFRIVEETEY